MLNYILIFIHIKSALVLVEGEKIILCVYAIEVCEETEEMPPFIILK